MKKIPLKLPVNMHLKDKFWLDIWLDKCVSWPRAFPITSQECILVFHVEKSP